MRTQIFVLAVAVALSTTCVYPQPTGFADSKALLSDAATDAEVSRISKLPVPVYELLPDAVREAQAAQRSYRELQTRELPAPAAEGQLADSDARAGGERLIAAVTTCDAAAIEDSLNSIRDAFGRVPNLGFEYDNDPRFLAKLTPAEKSANQNLSLIFSDSTPDAVCARLRLPDTQRRAVEAITNSFSRYHKLSAHILSTYAEQKPRAKKLEDAWQQREVQLTDALNKSRVGADQLLNQLPWYIGIFCAFGLSLVGMMRLFHGDVQMEWIASGQVIQFATVMVLLIVIAALGIAHVLNENTLGTLLGGVAGYVLSQGVGRAVARATERAVDTGTKRGVSAVDIRSDVIARLVPYTTTTPSSDALTLEGDLKIDAGAREKLTSELNALIRQRGGHEVSSDEVGRAATVGGLITLITNALR